MHELVQNEWPGNNCLLTTKIYYLVQVEYDILNVSWCLGVPLGFAYGFTVMLIISNILAIY